MNKVATVTVEPSASRADDVARNQIGQKLGRKGQQARERILTAMLELLADPDGPPVTLTSVARSASMRLTNLYLYFPDMGELLLAALGRVMATAEDGYLELLRQRWPDEGLEAACLAFLQAHHAFWQRHARLLHMRNALADASDMRVFHYRHTVTRPLIGLLAAQLETSEKVDDPRCMALATVLLTCIERTATVLTHQHYRLMNDVDVGLTGGDNVSSLLSAEAEVMARVIAGRRAMA